MENTLTGVLKFQGPSVKEGIIEAEKLGKVILATNDALKKIASAKAEYKGIKPILKVQVRQGSVEIALFIAAAGYLAKTIGINELGKGYFGELGKQLALKQFAKNKPVTREGQPKIDNRKMYVTIINTEGSKKVVDVESLKLFWDKLLDKDLSAIVEPLEKDQIESLQLLVTEDSVQTNIAEVEVKDKEYIVKDDAFELEPEEAQEFDDKQAEIVDSLKGKLVSYQALASKYPFKFQPREQQKLYGKRFILCMLADENNRDEYIELMKSYIGNVILKGIGVKDSEGRFTKIKISSIEKDEDPELNFG